MRNREYLRPKQASEKYNIDDGTLANWRTRDKGPPYIKRGGIILYPTDGFEQWLDEGRHAPGAVDTGEIEAIKEGVVRKCV